MIRKINWSLIGALLFCILFLVTVAYAFTYTYDTATPAGSDDPAEADDRMREIKLAIQEVMDVEHDWALTGTSLTGDGKHTDITTDSITNAGAYSGTTIAASSNATVGGTLDVSGNIDPTTYETTNGGFLDEDAMGSDAADKVASQQSIKAYVDTQIAFSVYTNEDSDTNAMLKDHAYLAATDGFVNVMCMLSEVTDELKGYVGATDDPAGAGTQICRQMTGSTANAAVTITLHVAAGEYFEIVVVSASTPTIYWKSRGTLSKPVDQD